MRSLRSNWASSCCLLLLVIFPPKKKGEWWETWFKKKIHTQKHFSYKNSSDKLVSISKGLHINLSREKNSLKKKPPRILERCQLKYIFFTGRWIERWNTCPRKFVPFLWIFLVFILFSFRFLNFKNMCLWKGLSLTCVYTCHEISKIIKRYICILRLNHCFQIQLVEHLDSRF